MLELSDKSAKLALQLEKECDVMYDCDTSSLSGCNKHLEVDTKVLVTSLLYFAYFIQKHFLKDYSIEQFSTILGIRFCVWRLLENVSEAGWDCFKISSQSDAFTLIETMKTVYNLDSIPMSFSDVEITVDIPEAENFAFILVTNKKYKRKSKALFFPSMSFSYSRSKILFVSRAFPLSNAVTSCLVLKLVTTCHGSAMTFSPATITSKTIQVQIVPSLVSLVSKPKSKVKLFA